MKHPVLPIDVSRETEERLARYVALLQQWSPRINLVSRGTLDDVWTRHIADALQLLPHARPSPAPWTDLGSGAGLPGLVLAIAADVAVDLVESDQRKAVFLREAARLTGAPVTVHAVRNRGGALGAGGIGDGTGTGSLA